MSRRVIKVPLSAAGIQSAIDEVERCKDWLAERTQALLTRLAQEGYEVASARFARSEYDGTNDTKVTIEMRGENVMAVVALGAAVLFIEFGTGVTYPDNHPEAAGAGMVRGAYGQGKGKQRTWGYYGEPGTNGRESYNPKTGRTVVLTHGNPANMAMYETVKELRERLPVLCREVFR